MARSAMETRNDHAKGQQPEFVPKFFTLLKTGIPRQQFQRDVVAGLVVGIVAIPLAIAFAIASGVGPEKGLITAIVAGMAISIFGGSRVQIGGPTGAFIVIVAGIVARHGVHGLTIATFMAGILIMLMGFLRAGRLLKFFPNTLIVGFTSGIAVIILVTQLKDLFGITVTERTEGVFDQIMQFAAHLSQFDPMTLSIGVATIAIIIFLPKINSTLPAPLVAIVVATMAVWWLHWPVDTIESRFGDLPEVIPAPEFLQIDLATIRELIQPAIAIALLGSIESLLSAVVADGMIGGRHRSNMELVAQGGANMLSAIFGGIPATGAIARTATNVKNGGRTPVAGIVHALVLLLTMLFAAPLVGMIPMASLAAVLVVVAWNMGEWRNFISALRGNRYDAVVLVVTFLITVIFDLVLAIEVGMVLAAFLFMKRMSDVTDMRPVLGNDDEGDEQLTDPIVAALGKDVLMYEISGPLFFGAAQKFQLVLNEIHDRHRVLVLRMRHVPLIDATGIARLKDIVTYMRSRRKEVYLFEVDPRVLAELVREPWFDRRHVLEDTDRILRKDTDR